MKCYNFILKDLMPKKKKHGRLFEIKIKKLIEQTSTGSVPKRIHKS